MVLATTKQDFRLVHSPLKTVRSSVLALRSRGAEWVKISTGRFHQKRKQAATVVSRLACRGDSLHQLSVEAGLDRFSAVRLQITLRTATFGLNLGLNFEFADLGKTTFPQLPVEKFGSDLLSLNPNTENCVLSPCYNLSILTGQVIYHLGLHFRNQSKGKLLPTCM